MEPRLSRNIAIAICAVIFCLGIVTYGYAQNASWPGLKIGEDKTPYVAVAVNGEISGDKIILHWDQVDHPKFSGYKVVISKSNPNPKYPDDGYLYYITERTMTSAVINNSEAYKNGDFGEKLVPGEKYYFSITVLYSDKTVPGDSLQLTYPGGTAVSSPEPAEEAIVTPAETTQPTKETPATEIKPAVKPVVSSSSSSKAPQVTVSTDNNRLIVKWNPIYSESFQGYKVVISKNNSRPAYPSSGYLTYITNQSTSRWVIDNSTTYHGGDFGCYLTPGQAYYVSVTALYSDGKVAGNAVRVTYPADGYNPLAEKESVQQSQDPIAISATASGSNLILSWPASEAANFEGYKVVISKSNPNPKYPNDGYLEWITDRNRTSVTINADTYYQGDIQGNLVSGEYYYFSISIIYDGWIIVPGPAQYVMIP